MLVETPPLVESLEERPRRWRKTALAWLPGLLILGGLIWLVAANLAEEHAFAQIVAQSRPQWLLVAALLQAATYATAGEAWRISLRARGHRFSRWTLMRLAVMKLTTDQVIPTGGMSGTVLVARRLHGMGVPREAIATTLVSSILGYYVTYAATVFVALAILASNQGLSPLVAAVGVVFGLLAAGIPMALVGLLGRRPWRAPRWLQRLPWVASTIAGATEATPLLTIDRRLVLANALPSLGTFLLDAATLNVALLAIGVRVDLSTCFAALVLGLVASTVGFMPAGLGTFEAVAVATLHHGGVPVASALSAVVLLRGFTFWLPMIPGLILLRRSSSRKDVNAD